MPKRSGQVQQTQTAALEVALAALTTTTQDEAAIALARRYAKAIDDGGAESLVMVGRSYREVLVELGMTPKARAALAKGGQNAPAASGLDELRERRERRAKK